MFDKLFVRVRSWLHASPQPAAAGAAGFGAADGARKYVGSPSARVEPRKEARNGNGNGRKGSSKETPPPLPPDAWMESESGMVITESGIIIIDPTLMDSPGAAPPPPPRGVPADSAWALPNLPRPGAVPTAPAGPRAAGRSTEDMDWDEVLARARANLSGTAPKLPTSSLPPAIPARPAPAAPAARAAAVTPAPVTPAPVAKVKVDSRPTSGKGQDKNDKQARLDKPAKKRSSRRK